jgi:hypothetical protein
LFIPFEFLGHNQRVGYFDMRKLVNETSDCTNENPETIHVAVWHDGWNPLFWLDDAGVANMLGEPCQVADLYQALGRYLLHNELSEPLDEEEVENDWLVSADAAYIAYRTNEVRFPDPKDAQLQNTITAAGRRGAIRTRQGASGKTYFYRRSVEEWAEMEQPKSGRPRKTISDLIENFDGNVGGLQHELAAMARTSTGKIPQGQLWQPCEHPGCNNEPVCMNCMKCQEKHCHCFD